MAQLVGADAKEIIFTSGATESNNIAIKGVANFYKSALPSDICFSVL
jgi:cysteine desulfurase